MTQRIGVTYLPMFPNSSAPYHMALFYDKGDGSEPTVIEFSPKNRSLGIGEEVAGLWSDLQGNRDRTYRFGPLVGDERKWRSRGNDPESNDNLRRKESLAQGDDLSAPWAIIQGTADEANRTRYAYFPLSQNSNTFVAEALARAGLPLCRKPSRSIHSSLRVATRDSRFQKTAILRHSPCPTSLRQVRMDRRRSGRG